MYRSALSRTLNGCVAGPSRLPRVAPLQQMLSISHREPLVPARARSSIRNFSASSRRREQQQQQDGNAQKLGEIEPKLALTFTCTVEGCGERSSHQFTKRSYERGIVLVQVRAGPRLHCDLLATTLTSTIPVSWVQESTPHRRSPRLVRAGGFGAKDD